MYQESVRMENAIRAASCLLSFRVTDRQELQSLVQQVTVILKANLDLDLLSSIPLNQGSLHVFSSPKDGPNPTLTAVLKTYEQESLVTLDLEGAAPVNCAAITGSAFSGNFAAGIEDKAINNNSMDRLRDTLSAQLTSHPVIEKIPVIKRSPDVPVYFASSDERMFEYDFDQTVFEKKSEYQKVCIYHSPTLGNALFLDDLQNLAEADLSYTRGIMHYGHNEYQDKEILILGGGDGALLHELMKEKPAFVTMVDIDAVVMDACKVHLRGACGSTLDSFQTDKYHVIVGDCVKFMEECITSGKKFDYVFNDLTDIPLSSQSVEVANNLWSFVRQLLDLSFKCLKDQGKYLNHVSH